MNMMVEPTWARISMIGFLVIITLLIAVSFYFDKRKSLAMAASAVCMVAMYFAMLAPAIHTTSRTPTAAAMMGAPVPGIKAGISMIGLLFILGLFFAIAFFAVKRKSLVVLLTGVAVAAFLMAFVMVVSRKVVKMEAPVVQQQVTITDGSNAARDADALTAVVDQVNQPLFAPPSSAEPHDPKLDALWEKLTEAQIQLDDVALDNRAPQADPGDAKLKRNISREFGLGEEGSLPPTWVVNPPKVVGNVLRKTVSSDPYLTEEECLRQLETEYLPQAVCRRTEQLAASQAGQAVAVTNLLPLGIGTDYILREICRDEFTGTLDTSVGEMKRAHVLLEFTGTVDNYLRDSWLRHERTSRLAGLGRVAGIILAGLAVVYGLLKLDTTTHGYYSRQLLWAGLAAIIAAIVASS
jgi:hypothetical protein